MIVDKGVVAAAALLIGGVALAVEGLRAAGAVELGVAGRTRGLLRDKLLPASDRAVGKLHALRAHPGPGQDTVELDAVARGPVRQIEIAGAVGRDRDLRGRDACPELQDACIAA